MHVTQVAVDAAGHPVAPFDFSLMLLLAGTCAVWLTWDENFGSEGRPLKSSLVEAWEAIRTDKHVRPDNAAASVSVCVCVRVCVCVCTCVGQLTLKKHTHMHTPAHTCTYAHTNTYTHARQFPCLCFAANQVLRLGLLQSLFEGAMYTFVFIWTPALQELVQTDGTLPLGTIFATFMICCAIGGALFKVRCADLRKEQRVHTLDKCFLSTSPSQPHTHTHTLSLSPSLSLTLSMLVLRIVAVGSTGRC